MPSWNTNMLGEPIGFLGGVHVSFALSSAACALRLGGGVGVRRDPSRRTRGSRRELRQPRLTDLLFAPVHGDLPGRAPHTPSPPPRGGRRRGARAPLNAA